MAKTPEHDPLEEVRAATRNHHWREFFLGATLLSSTAYAAYRELVKHQEELEADDPIEALVNLGKKMEAARRDRDEIFHHLQGGTKRAFLIDGAAELATTREPIFIPSPPMLRSIEIGLWGGLWYQKINIDTSPPEVPERTTVVESNALVGANHLIHNINILDPKRGEKIDRILTLHPIGDTAIKARNRHFRSG